jgi:hypothetical protein
VGMRCRAGIPESEAQLQLDAGFQALSDWPKHMHISGELSPTQPSLSWPRSPVSMQWQLKQACCRDHGKSLLASGIVAR